MTIPYDVGPDSHPSGRPFRNIFPRIDPDAEAERLAAMRSGVPTAETPAKLTGLTCEPIAVSKLVSDAATFSTAGYVLLKMGSEASAVLTFEIHDDGIVIAPDGWVATFDGDMITGARHTGRPSPDAHLRRWRSRGRSDA